VGNIDILLSKLELLKGTDMNIRYGTR